MSGNTEQMHTSFVCVRWNRPLLYVYVYGTFIFLKTQGAVVAKQIRPQTSIPEVPGSNPGPAVVPWARRFILIA